MVKHYDDFTVNWEIRLPGGSSWQSAGTTSLDLYLTLSEPVASRTLYHTSVHIGSHYGTGATTEDDLILAVWSYFQGRSIAKQNETTSIGSLIIGDAGAQLVYWKDYGADSDHANAPFLLFATHGNCGSMSDLFISTVQIQGIDQTNEQVQITSNIVVKSWDTTGPQVATSHGLVDLIIFKPYDDASGITMDKWDYGPARDHYALSEHTQLVDLPGISGQNNANPASIFVGHSFVRYIVAGVERWFDTSYGVEYVGSTADSRMNDFEDKSLYGFYSDIKDIELVIGIDLDGDGSITNDKNMTLHVKRYGVSRQEPGVREVDYVFQDF